MNLLTTFRGSMMEGFLPAGWDLEKIDRLADLAGPAMLKPCSWWHPEFEPVACGSLADFDTYMGHEIAREIQLTGVQGRPLAMILPVGPMGRLPVRPLSRRGCQHRRSDRPRYRHAAERQAL